MNQKLPTEKEIIRVLAPYWGWHYVGKNGNLCIVYDDEYNNRTSEDQLIYSHITHKKLHEVIDAIGHERQLTYIDELYFIHRGSRPMHDYQFDKEETLLIMRSTPEQSALALYMVLKNDCVVDYKGES